MPCLICPRVPPGEGKSCLSAPPDQQVSPSACPSAFGSSATAAFCRLFHCLHICEYKFVSLLLFFFFFRSRGSVVLCNVAQRPRCITAIHLKPQRQTGPFFCPPSRRYRGLFTFPRVPRSQASSLVSLVTPLII